MARVVSLVGTTRRVCWNTAPWNNMQHVFKTTWMRVKSTRNSCWSPINTLSRVESSWCVRTAHDEPHNPLLFPQNTSSSPSPIQTLHWRPLPYLPFHISFEQLPTKPPIHFQIFPHLNQLPKSYHLQRGTISKHHSTLTSKPSRNPCPNPGHTTNLVTPLTQRPEHYDGIQNISPTRDLGGLFSL